MDGGTEDKFNEDKHKKKQFCPYTRERIGLSERYIKHGLKDTSDIVCGPMSSFHRLRTRYLQRQIQQWLTFQQEAHALVSQYRLVPPQKRRRRRTTPLTAAQRNRILRKKKNGTLSREFLTPLQRFYADNNPTTKQHLLAVKKPRSIKKKLTAIHRDKAPPRSDNVGPAWGEYMRIALQG